MPCGPCSPRGPVSPCGPVAPVAPVGPCSPCGPTGPMGPVSPLSPFSPCGPWMPWEPWMPCLPWGPVAPCGPVGPCGPVEPVGPCGPAAPIAPASPLSPFSPRIPCSPCGPRDRRRLAALAPRSLLPLPEDRWVRSLRWPPVVLRRPCRPSPLADPGRLSEPQIQVLSLPGARRATRLPVHRGRACPPNRFFRPVSSRLFGCLPDNALLSESMSFLVTSALNVQASSLRPAPA